MPGKKARRVVALLLVLSAAGGYAAWRGGHLALPRALAPYLPSLTGGERAVTGGLTLYGNVDMREVQLAFRENYRIETIYVDEGTRVRKGQPIAKLDTRHLEENVRRAEAVAEMRRHVYADLAVGSRPEEVAEAEARVAAAASVHDRARRDLERNDYLAATKTGSVRDLHHAQAAALIAAAELRQARERLALVVQGNRPEAIAAARSDLAVAEADSGLARHRLEDGTLVAPDDGVVHNRLLQVGDMAAPDRPVMSLALTNPIWVRTYVEEPHLERVRPGARAWVTTDAGNRYGGWIGFVSPVAEFTPRAVETPSVRTELVYQVRVLVCDPAGALRLGMPTTIHLPEPGPPDAAEPAPDDARRGCDAPRVAGHP